MDERVYRLRRVADGKWYGTASHRRVSDEDKHWHTRAGKYMSAASLNQVLQGFHLDDLPDLEIVPYKIQEEYPMDAYRIKLNQGHCGKCGELIVSRHRHDFVTCKCGAASVDGGNSYLRRCGSVKDCSVMEPVTIKKQEWED